MDEPAEQAEIFQYELLKIMKRISETLDKMEKHLDALSKK